MEDTRKTREQLLDELTALRHQTKGLQTRIETLTEQRDRLWQQIQIKQPIDLSSCRVALLQQLTASLAGALTTVEIFDILLHQGVCALNATRGWVAQRCRNQPDTIEIVKTVGYSALEIDSYRQVPLDRPMPATDAIRREQMVVIQTPQDYCQRYPDLAEHFIAAGHQSLVALPLTIRRQVIGSLGWSFAEPQAFNEADCNFMMTLAHQCAQALERAYLYESERLAREMAEAANRVKDEFLAVLSHELRSPLNPILGWAKMLRSRQFNAQMTDRGLDAIERNAKLQIQLIEDLLDVSHILQGKLRLNSATVNLVSVIEAALETVRLAAETKSIDLQFVQATDAAAFVAGDPARLQQIVWNLVSNAVKFTPASGRVEVRLEQIKTGHSKQPIRNPSTVQGLNSPSFSGSLLPSASYVQISVTDTGKGIDPAFLPFIFDYFRQADSTITRQFGGLGLGLTIVRHLVELHGGNVQVESKGEGQGATFRVILPLLKTSPPAETTSVKPDHPPLPHFGKVLDQARILVVDDDADMREYVEVVLREAGARVLLASSAGEALAKLSRFRPDVLLSDLGMPNVDGYMLLKQIRTLMPELGGQVPAIALSAYASEYNQQQILAAGFQLHIAKPVEPKALVMAVASLLAKK